MTKMKEAFQKLHEKMMNQLAETTWLIKRIEPLNQEETEKLQGKGVIKEKLLKDLEFELKERKKNIEVLDKIIKDEDKKKNKTKD